MTLRSNTAFRRLFAGRLVTNAGDSLYLLATMWLVFDLTGSTLYTGLAGFLLTLPTVFGFLLGPLADRWPSRPVLVVSQLVQAVAVGGVLVAWLAGVRSVWLLLAVVPLLTLVNQVAYPTMNAVLPRLVEREDLMAANSSFAVAFQGFDMVFNAVGGIVIALLGAITLYALNVLTFLVAAVAYAAVAIPAPLAAPGRPGATADGGLVAPTTYLEDLREGVAVFRHSALWKVSAAIFFGVVSQWAMLVALPAFAALRGGPALYGLLLAGYASGFLLGFLLAPWLQDRRFGRLTALFGLVGALAWLGVVTVESIPVIVALTGVTTLVIGYVVVSVQTVFQTVVPERLLGRTTALHISIAGGSAPLGAVIGGLVGETVGVVAAVSLFAVGHLSVALFFLLDGELRGLPPVSAMTAGDLRLPEPAE